MTKDLQLNQQELDINTKNSRNVLTKAGLVRKLKDTSVKWTYPTRDMKHFQHTTIRLKFTGQSLEYFIHQLMTEWQLQINCGYKSLRNEINGSILWASISHRLDKWFMPHSVHIREASSWCGCGVTLYCFIILEYVAGKNLLLDRSYLGENLPLLFC